LEAIERDEGDSDDDEDDEEERLNEQCLAMEENQEAPNPEGEGQQVPFGPRPGARGRRRVRKPARITFGGFNLTGRAAELAQKAKLQFGGIGMTEYNRVAVRRWLNRELDKLPSVRTADKLRWLPTMELYVFYRSTADVQMEEAIKELDAMGLIRNGGA